MKKITKNLIGILASTVALGTAGIIKSNLVQAVDPPQEQSNTEQQIINVRFKVRGRRDYLIPISLDRHVDPDNIKELRNQLNNQYFQDDRGINFASLKKGNGEYVTELFGQQPIDALDNFLKNRKLTEKTRAVKVTVSLGNSPSESKEITLNVPTEIKTIPQIREYFNAKFFARFSPLDQPIISNFKFGDDNGTDLGQVQVILVGWATKKYDEIKSDEVVAKAKVVADSSLPQQKLAMAISYCGDTYCDIYRGDNKTSITYNSKTTVGNLIDQIINEYQHIRKRVLSEFERNSDNYDLYLNEPGYPSRKLDVNSIFTSFKFGKYARLCLEAKPLVLKTMKKEIPDQNQWQNINVRRFYKENKFSTEIIHLKRGVNFSDLRKQLDRVVDPDCHWHIVDFVWFDLFSKTYQKVEDNEDLTKKDFSRYALCARELKMETTKAVDSVNSPATEAESNGLLTIKVRFRSGKEAEKITIFNNSTVSDVIRILGCEDPDYIFEMAKSYGFCADGKKLDENAVIKELGFDLSHQIFDFIDYRGQEVLRRNDQGFIDRKLMEPARQNEEARKAEEATRHQAEEQTRRAEAERAEEARRAEQERQAKQARLAEEVARHQAEEDRRANEAKASQSTISPQPETNNQAVATAEVEIIQIVKNNGEICLVFKSNGTRSFCPNYFEENGERTIDNKILLSHFIANTIGGGIIDSNNKAIFANLSEYRFYYDDQEFTVDTLPEFEKGKTIKVVHQSQTPVSVQPESSLDISDFYNFQQALPTDRASHQMMDQLVLATKPKASDLGKFQPLKVMFDSDDFGFPSTRTFYLKKPDHSSIKFGDIKGRLESLAKSKPFGYSRVSIPVNDKIGFFWINQEEQYYYTPIADSDDLVVADDGIEAVKIIAVKII